MCRIYTGLCRVSGVFVGLQKVSGFRAHIGLCYRVSGLGVYIWLCKTVSGSEAQGLNRISALRVKGSYMVFRVIQGCLG